ncbi:hypothetical protein ACH6CV_03670 [Bacillota bacterium Meth-B3]|nr:hypothetical protein [Christensenellaceae bacterium]MEA5066088.1 hypothetical protein [Eubacteriales bacterium]MEA5069901.1 hypothetical protein [Christensenellaceae bacterium]
MKFVRRFLWFIASRLLIFSVIVSVLILAFYLAMNTANIYILLSDGMKLRTQVVLTRQDAEDLPSFFRDDFLSSDQALAVGFSDQSPYRNYKVTSFDSDVKLEWVWSWPWEDVAQATMVHRVSAIRGSVLSEKAALVKSGVLPASPPAWQGGRYKMTLHRAGGRWKIAGMTQTQVILEPTPAPTPAPAPAQ